MNTTIELSSTSTPVRVHSKKECPNAPLRKVPEFQEFQERFREWVEMHNLTLDLSNLSTADCATPPNRQANKRRRVSLSDILNE